MPRVLNEQREGEDGVLLIPASPWFDPDRILDCGQCFRWRRGPDGRWSGVVGNLPARLHRRGDGWRLESLRGSEAFWRAYFDLETDYNAVEGQYRGLDSRLDTALELGRGIRILRQPFWETTVSFVLSANNNIPRIQGMIGRLCEAAGEPLGADCYGFPAPEAAAGLSEAHLRAMGFGYRAPFVVRLAEGFAAGRWAEDRFREGSTETARKGLLELPGVGPKVADCILLFSLGRRDAFPVDTWIKKTLAALDQGKPQGQHILNCLTEPCENGFAGYVQQVLFYAARYQKWGI